MPYIRHIVPEMRQRATTLFVEWGPFPSLTSMLVWYGVCSTGDVRLRHAKTLSSKRGDLDEASNAYSVLILSGQLVE